MKRRLIFSLFMPIAIMATSCNKDSEDASKRNFENALEIVADLQTVQAYADAEVAIERLRKKSDGPDWAAIREKFNTTLPVVKRIDKAFGLDYEREISEALTLCESGQRPDVNQQILAKGLQHVTVLAIGEELNTLAADGESAKQYAAAKIIFYFAGIRPTFDRRDEDFFPGRHTLGKTANAALMQIQKAVKENQNILAPRRSLEEVIAQTYALCVLFEIQEIERLRATDRLKCDVKKMEALVFYRIIRDRIKKRNREADKMITAMLEADYDKMDASVIEDALTKGMPNISLR